MKNFEMTTVLASKKDREELKKIAKDNNQSVSSLMRDFILNLDENTLKELGENKNCKLNISWKEEEYNNLIEILSKFNISTTDIMRYSVKKLRNTNIE